MYCFNRVTGSGKLNCIEKTKCKLQVLFLVKKTFLGSSVCVVRVLFLLELMWDFIIKDIDTRPNMIKKILNVFDSIEETDPDYGPLVISESFFLNFYLSFLPKLDWALYIVFFFFQKFMLCIYKSIDVTWNIIVMFKVVLLGVFLNILDGF